jgi:hypothetical protein
MATVTLRPEDFLFVVLASLPNAQLEELKDTYSVSSPKPMNLDGGVDEADDDDDLFGSPPKDGKYAQKDDSDSDYDERAKSKPKKKKQASKVKLEAGTEDSNPSTPMSAAKPKATPKSKGKTSTPGQHTRNSSFRKYLSTLFRAYVD